MSKIRIIFALSLIGFYAIVSQVLIIREFLITFSGNELSIGIFFANWLLLEAVGSYSAGRITKKINHPASAFATLQLLLALSLPIIVYGIRIIRVNMGTNIGEAMPIPVLFTLSMIFLLPIALVNGAQFSIGCRVFSSYRKDTTVTIGSVYVYEAIGSLVGGVVVTYICLTYLNTFQSVFLLSVTTSLSALLLLSKDKNDHRSHHIVKSLRILHLLILSIFTLILALGGSTAIHNKSVAVQWPGYQVVSHQNSIYGNAVLLERDDQFELLSNGVPILSLPTSDISEIEETAHLPLLFHPHPKSVFLLGGGLNGVLREIIKHPVSRIDYAELDPILIDIILHNVPDSNFAYLDDNRIHLHKRDGRQFLLASSHIYDVIILNLPDPSTLEINRYYTREFFTLCKKHLTPSGILFFKLPGGASYMNISLMQLNACILESVESVFQSSRVFPFESVSILASDDNQILRTDQDTLSMRMIQKKIQTLSLSKRYLSYLFNPMRIEWYLKERRQISSPGQNSDLKPRAVYYDLLYWNDHFSPTFSKFYSWLDQIKFSHLAILFSLIFIFLALLPGNRFNKQRISAGTVIATSGFTGMGLTLIMILLFQALFGYIYFWIGMIVSSFMLGLAVGGMIATKWWIKSVNQHLLILMTEFSQLIYFIALLASFLYLDQTGGTITDYTILSYLILLATGLGGFITGTQFPLAGQIFQRDRYKMAETAGIIYGLDLLGAWFAGIIVSLYLIPLLGMINTIMIFILFKAGSGLLLFLAGKKS